MIMLPEEYRFDSEGYNPYIIREGWQVAKLNYLPTHGFTDLTDLEVHHSTDEVFVLICGSAALVCGHRRDDHWFFEVSAMQQGVSYNVPRGVAHNIAMSRNAEIIIVEAANTHLHDVEHLTLSADELARMTQQILETV